jgi:PAS domain S-box-containing protein
MESVRWFAVLQALITTGLVVILWCLHARLSDRPFFRWWALAWSAFGLFLVVGALALPVTADWTLLRAGAVLAATLLGFLQPPLLVFGAWSLRSPEVMTERRRTVGIGLALGAGTLSFVLSLFWPNPLDSFAVRMALRTLALAGALFFCASVFLTRWRQTGSWGSGLTGAFCLLYGLHQGFYTAVFITRVAGSALGPLQPLFDLTMIYRFQVFLLDLIGVYGICLGMVLLLIEDYRQSQDALHESVSVGRIVRHQNVALQNEIAERQRAEEALRLSEARFSTVFRFHPNSMTITTLDDGRFLEVNEAFELEMGFSRDEVIGRTALELGLWWDPSERGGVMADVNRTSGALTREIRFRTKAGQPLTALYAAARIDIEGHPPLLLAVCENITARKEAEATQRAMLKALPDWMFLVSKEGVFLDFHARDRRNLLSPPEVFMGRNVRDILPPDVADGLMACFEQAMKTDEPRTFEYSLPIRGEPHYYEARVVRCDNDKVLSIVRDISERKRAEQEARGLRDELAHAGRVTTLGALTGSLAHEINQPLAAIMTNAQAALRLMTASQPDLVELRAALTDIIADNGRAAEVLRRLRTLLRKETSEYRSLDINDSVEEIVKLIRTDAIERQISFDIDLCPNLPPVLGDRVQLQQVTLNLLMNAFDAVRDRNVGARQVTLRTCPVDGRVAVTVTDAGFGLNADQMAQVFEPFYTTKVDGMGLGLSICQTIIAAHDGAISAERNAGPGMTFSFSLHALDGMAAGEGRSDTEYGSHAVHDQLIERP